MGHSTSSGRNKGGSSAAMRQYREEMRRIGNMDGLNAMGRRAQNDSRISNEEYMQLMAEGTDRVRFASRQVEAWTMLENGAMQSDTYSQLALSNFSNEILNTAVERGWITRRQASRIRRLG